LLAEIGRRDDQDPPLSLRPLLRQDQPRLDGLSEPHLVGQQRPLREGRPEREEGGVDLVGVQIHLRIHERSRQLLDAIRGKATC